MIQPQTHPRNLCRLEVIITAHLVLATTHRFLYSQHGWLSVRQGPACQPAFDPQIHIPSDVLPGPPRSSLHPGLAIAFVLGEGVSRRRRSDLCSHYHLRPKEGQRRGLGRHRRYGQRRGKGRLASRPRRQKRCCGGQRGGGERQVSSVGGGYRLGAERAGVEEERSHQWVYQRGHPDFEAEGLAWEGVVGRRGSGQGESVCEIGATADAISPLLRYIQSKPPPFISSSRFSKSTYKYSHRSISPSPISSAPTAIFFSHTLSPSFRLTSSYTARTWVSITILIPDSSRSSSNSQLSLGSFVTG